MNRGKEKVISMDLTNSIKSGFHWNQLLIIRNTFLGFRIHWIKCRNKHNALNWIAMEYGE